MEPQAVTQLAPGDRVPCMVCKKEFRSLAPFHLATHDLTSEQYLGEFPGAPLVSRDTNAARQAKFAVAISHRRTGKRQQAENGRGSKSLRCPECGRKYENLIQHVWLAHGAKQAAKLRGRVISGRISVIRASNMIASNNRHHDGHLQLALKAVELSLLGLEDAAIGTQAGTSRNYVGQMVRAAGLSTKARALWDLGEPFDWRRLTTLRTATGLSPKQFSDVFGLPLSTFRSVHRPAHYAVRRDLAENVIRRRDQIIRGRADLKPGVHEPGTRDVLKTLIPELSRVLRLLRSGLTATRALLLADGLAEWKQHLYEKAKRERAGAPRGTLFRKFLPLALQLSPFIEGEVTKMRDGEPNWKAAPRILAARFGIGPATVNQVLYEGRLLKPDTMKGIILEMRETHPPEAAKLAPAKGEPAATKERGHKKGYMTPATEKILLAAAALEASGMNRWNAAPKAYQATEEGMDTDQRRRHVKKLGALISRHPKFYVAAVDRSRMVHK